VSTRSAAVNDRGQAAVEFAIALPLVVILVLGIVQVILIARDQIAVELAAREGARAATVAANPTSAATRSANEAISLRPLDVSASTAAERVTVTVRHRSQTTVALIGPLIPDVELSATVTMTREPP
jgi:Flp pilus assembly protein TadG